MADKKISQLTPATTPLAGTEELPIVQGGSTVKVSVNNLTAGKAVTASQLTVENSTSNDAVRITQTGAGNALVVEDSTNPDASPFVVDTNGRFIHGYTSALTLRGITWNNLFAGIDASTAGSALARYSANASSAILEFFKSRNASISGNTVVQSGDALGAVIFSGADGTDFVQGASINASVDGTPGTNDMPGRLVFSTTADGASSPTERMRIDNAGNVGIGTAAPGTLLDVQKIQNATTAIQVANTDAGASASARLLATNGTATGGVIMRGTGTTEANYLVIYNSSTTAPVTIYTNGSERMRIDSAGNVGIGTSAPNAAARLDVSSTTSGFLPPRMTTAQRDAITSPPDGLMLYNTTTNKLQVRAASAWVDLH